MSLKCDERLICSIVGMHCSDFRQSRHDLTEYYRHISSSECLISLLVKVHSQGLLDRLSLVPNVSSTVLCQNRCK